MLHSQIPWIIQNKAMVEYGWDITTKNGLWICQVMNSHKNYPGFPSDKEGEANARFIIQACNSYYDLQEKLLKRG